LSQSKMPPQQSHGLLDLISQMLDLGTHVAAPQNTPLMSCPHSLRASMIAAGESWYSSVIMDCREKPGYDKMKVDRCRSPYIWPSHPPQ
jgi:hypothetical protein